ncbi:cation:proton antiporter [Clostridium botulinum]|uniref:cation:proton antiporter n=1 Tax=Clostridium botulinum TaxID=1491 RepID=UPI0014507690|nr:cation:proton antiporter [Clostridium botulinum]MBY6810894.1 cation:proton antiporter [Clostridium botulinum]MBY6824362.1 cation:proton antiporter [Clostridium botulinum]MBY6834816.1 cation:proton antiporter [Clostridium botulinum]MBY6973139.1 cation:proton antiporter [Clostridium botulinum]NFO05007.1 cation:proton antiporter [Clostridium botulinum]
MNSYDFLFDLALILLTTKVLGIANKRFQLPQVVGALMAGVLFGPTVFNLLNETDFITQLSEIGVIVLMFCAGLETDINELKKSRHSSFIIALIGVLVPLIGGFLVSFFFNNDPSISDASSSIILQNIFIGVILTATSVSITVETLKEMGKLSTRVGSAILGAAIIDDILGIIALTIVTSFADSNVNVWIVLFKIFAFFIFAAICCFIFYKFFSNVQLRHGKGMRRFVILSFVYCLILSYCAEVFFGVADITGAFIAGLIISKTTYSKYIASRFEILSYMFLSPVFFASIGIKFKLPAMNLSMIMFSILLVIVAILTKIIGCGLAAKLCNFSSLESIQIGTGMVSRGEVALIVANKGATLGLMSSVFFGPMIIMIIVTTVITPLLLKIVFSDKFNKLQNSKKALPTNSTIK